MIKKNVKFSEPKDESSYSYNSEEDSNETGGRDEESEEESVLSELDLEKVQGKLK